MEWSRWTFDICRESSEEENRQTNQMAGDGLTEQRCPWIFPASLVDEQNHASEHVSEP